MENRQKRNSILKVRKTVEGIEETMDNGRPELSTTNRRVSFQNLKQVKEFDRDHGKIINGTPMKEKITDTLDTDGILTPRGGNMDISDSQSACVTLQLFEGIDPAKETMDMSLETITNENNVTARMLDISAEKTLVNENTVEQTTKMTERIFSVPQSDETLRMFNSTICQHQDMDISVDGSTVSAAPKILKRNVTLNETVPMDLDYSRAVAGRYNETVNMFNVSNLENPAMDITLVENANLASKPASDIKPGLPENPIENEDLMDISVQQGSPVAVNDTMAMFKSPSRLNMKILPDPGIISKNETSGTIADESMEIEETLNLEDRKIVVKQLTLETTSVTERFQNLQDECKTLDENSDTVRISRTYQTEEDDVENERAHLNSSAMDVTQLGEDIDILNNREERQLRPQFSVSTEQSLAFHNSSVTVDVSGKLTEHEKTPKVMRMEAMQISAVDPTNTLMEINVDDNSTKMEGDNRKTIQVENSERTILENSMNQTATDIEKNIKNVENASVNLSETAIERQESMDVENEHSRMLTTSFNLSIHQRISKRRRSLLRESAVSRESPRRCIAEKSLLSMNIGTCTTPWNIDELSEQRQNAMKTSEDDVTLNSSLNKSARDIFTLNIAVRSPRNTSINGKLPATPYSLSHKSPLDSLGSPASKSPEFELPDFDPSVFNVIYLTPNNGEIFPEAAEFQKLVENEKKKMRLEIENGVKSGEFSAEQWEILKNNQLSKLTRDEREVVRIAREKAELRFLELRLKFAIEQRVKSEQQILELEEENAKMAELKRELENLPAIRAELDELKRRPTLAECKKIRQEYMEMTTLVWEQQMEAMRNTYKLALQIRDQRAALLREIEEKEEILNQLEEKEQQNKAEIENVVKNVMAHMI